MVQPSSAGHSPRRALQLLWVMGECQGRRAPWLQAILELARWEGGRGGVPRLGDEGTQGRFLARTPRRREKTLISPRFLFLFSLLLRMYLFEHLSTGTFNSEGPFGVELIFGLPRTPRAVASLGRSAGFHVRGRTVNALFPDTRANGRADLGGM